LHITWRRRPTDFRTTAGAMPVQCDEETQQREKANEQT
jgi:hypothetical protein